MTSKEFYKELNNKNIEEDDLQHLLVNVLMQHEYKAATAESCTGGLISKRITEVSGCSAVFDCGICSYSNAIKEKLLCVNHKTLDSYGAVSPQTAAEMAQGVRVLADAEIGISTTGVAGPTGGTPEKPVGLVYIACSSKTGTSVVKAELSDSLPATREQIRLTASSIALYLALSAVQEDNCSLC